MTNDEAISILAQPETHEKRTETRSCDYIERQQAIEALKDWYDGLVVSSFQGVEKVIKDLPSAQPELPELPEWAQKVEEYRKSAPSHIHNPLAWALYQVWKEYDR